MTDTKPKKTLSLKSKSASPAARPDGTPRQRTGARAKAAAQAQRQREQQQGLDGQGTPETHSPAASPSARRSAPAGAASGRSGSGRPTSRPDRDARPAREGRPDRDTRPGRTARHNRPDHDSREHRNDPPDHAQYAPRDIPAAEVETFPIFASCPQGLEDALSAELQALGFDDAVSASAGCRFRTDWTGVMRANLYSRLATRILMQVAHAPVTTEDDVFKLALHTSWERWFGPDHTLRVDTSAIRSPMHSLQFCNLRAKDGICDRLREYEGARPSIDTVRPDAKVHLFLDENSATLYLDTSGESLFKRGWRFSKGEAPIRENLAAGLLALSGWDPSQPLIDPFCGSGTILIEAAWIALGVPPGIWRPFAFERLRNHDEDQWHALKDEARTHIAPKLESPIVGYDLNPEAIQGARENLERAGLDADSVRFEVGDAREVLPPAASGWLVTNPPYGERLPHEDDDLWRPWSQNLKQNYSGWQVNIISSDMELPRALRLKPLRRYPLYNGGLECRLFSFEMAKGSYRD